MRHITSVDIIYNCTLYIQVKIAHIIQIILAMIVILLYYISMDRIKYVKPVRTIKVKADRINIDAYNRAYSILRSKGIALVLVIPKE